MFYNNEWGTVCDDSWDMSNAAVVCRQLGCGAAVSAPGSSRFGWGAGPIWLDDVSCTGRETNLSECQAKAWGIHNCHHGEDAGVVCAGESWDGAGRRQSSCRYPGAGSWLPSEEIQRAGLVEEPLAALTHVCLLHLHLKAKCKVLHMGRDNPHYRYGLGMKGL